MQIILSLITFLLLYFVPGYLLSRFSVGRWRNQPFWWLLLSFVTVPFSYVFLAFVNQVNLIGYLAFNLGLGLVALAVSKKLNKKSLIETDQVFGSKIVKDKTKSARAYKLATFGMLLIFFVLLLVPRYGLVNGYLPVGDDKPRVGQVTSIALSPQFPLHFRLPSTLMSIYYYNMVQPGLLTRFTDNFIPVNFSWFTHLAVTYGLFFWLIYLVTNYFARNYFEKFVMSFGMSFFGGLEFFLALLKGYTGWHLEWWGDWFSDKTVIHMQISAPSTANFWVTQHVLPVFLIFIIYMLMISQAKKRLTWLLIGILVAAIFGNSIFVFISFATAYGLYYLYQLLAKKIKLSELIKNNLIIASVSLILSVGIFLAILGSGKQDYFILKPINFFIFENVGLLKVVNFALTIPSYLLVELSFLLFIWIYQLYLFWKNKLYQKPILFLFLLTIPFLLIFIFRAKGDDNFSMRGTLPGWYVLAIFAGWTLGDLREKFKKHANLFVSGVLLLMLICIPTSIWELYHRQLEQFEFKNDLYAKIDEDLPLNSVVFVDSTSDPDPIAWKSPSHLKNYHDNIVHMGHRFTFKPVESFTITDIEYTSTEAKNKYLKYMFGSEKEIFEILGSEPLVNDNFRHYYLSDRLLPYSAVIEEGQIRIYDLDDPLK